mmetsp:Transcript_6463/g.9415  ORF Transcript_6463/g.9415 Transcript_6463/m.9415 type:complete len:205 (+) Transcript_6463:108-722(+)
MSRCLSAFRAASLVAILIGFLITHTQADEESGHVITIIGDDPDCQVTKDNLQHTENACCHNQALPGGYCALSVSGGACTCSKGSLKGNYEVKFKNECSGDFSIPQVVYEKKTNGSVIILSDDEGCSLTRLNKSGNCTATNIENTTLCSLTVESGGKTCQVLKGNLSGVYSVRDPSPASASRGGFMTVMLSTCFATIVFTVVSML